MSKINLSHESIKKMVTITVLMLLITLPLVKLCSTSEASSAKLPTWNKGDKWSYRLTVGPSSKVTLNETVTSENAEITIDKDKYQCYQITTEGNKSVETYFSKDTLAKVYTKTEDSGITFFKPPLPQFDFPIEVNKTWNGTTKSYEQEVMADPVERINYTYEVEKKMDFQVKAGTFTAYRINLSMASYRYNGTYPSGSKYSLTNTVYHYSPEVKNYLKVQSYEIRANGKRPVGTQELLSYDLTKGGDGNNGDNDSPGLGTMLMGITVLSTAVIYKFTRDGRGTSEKRREEN